MDGVRLSTSPRPRPAPRRWSRRAEAGGSAGIRVSRRWADRMTPAVMSDHRASTEHGDGRWWEPRSAVRVPRPSVEVRYRPPAGGRVVGLADAALSAARPAPDRASSAASRRDAGGVPDDQGRAHRRRQSPRADPGCRRCRRRTAHPELRTLDSGPGSVCRVARGRAQHRIDRRAVARIQSPASAASAPPSVERSVVICWRPDDRRSRAASGLASGPVIDAPSAESVPAGRCGGRFPGSL